MLLILKIFYKYDTTNILIFPGQNCYKVTRINSQISDSGTNMGTMVPIVVSSDIVVFFMKIRQHIIGSSFLVSFKSNSTLVKLLCLQ